MHTRNIVSRLWERQLLRQQLYYFRMVEDRRLIFIGGSGLLHFGVRGFALDAYASQYVLHLQVTFRSLLFVLKFNITYN